MKTKNPPEGKLTNFVLSSVDIFDLVETWFVNPPRQFPTCFACINSTHRFALYHVRLISCDSHDILPHPLIPSPQAGRGGFGARQNRGGVIRDL
ncbi:hypothetical protein DP116_26545 [Brasilonema bromeliae SPC951]|uniref:Uncharacterized protein n=1 Tax=Brasilonema bromeliae SPC951 TaxID=385972 RepID=A0ABX1PFT3_9CYAN|nr:hypothetical protein [Brasilonema bromeliae SPC951]